MLILLFADDMVLFGNSKEDLQFALNKFENYCDKWRLTVNTSKTKVMIFSIRKRLPLYGPHLHKTFTVAPSPHFTDDST